MITIIAEHSVDMDLLPEGANVLDIGCRGWDFTREMKLHGKKVFAVDIDDLGLKWTNFVNRPNLFTQCAISDFDGLCGLMKSNDEQATRIDKTGTGIDCYTLKSFSKMVGVDFWDLVKFDVEGSEYEIIMSLEKAPAKQLSIEFHLHTGIYTIFEMNAMENKLKELGYEQAKHEYTSQHGAGFNYWDSLFLLR